MVLPYIFQEHVQNSTLAGGVAIGAVADMPIGVFAALIIGFVAGSVSAFGFRFLNVSLSAIGPETTGTQNFTFS